MNKPKHASASRESNIRRQTIKLAWWTAAWLVTMAVATFGPQFLWTSNTPVTLLAIAVNVAAGFGMIRANRDHLKSLDEMQQRIQLEAMAATLGVGLVIGLAYSTLDTSNVIASDAEISHLVIVMALTYIAAILLGRRRYG